jgi:FkbM family methyltransferase|tara:strand:- start:75 stop:797 length:723 start_codon:yes stop_codon:yes gene_type:complete
MKKWLKMVVRETLRIFNLKLSFYDKSRPRYSKAIDSLGINVIFDIGANVGQFALATLDNGFRGKIISFEPTSEVYEKLKNKKQKFPNWQIHERAAVGEECGTIMINVAGNEAASSSILAMGKAHQDAAPEANFVGSESVSLITLDSVFKNYVSESSKCLLKIDVQGYEEQVLKGAEDSIQRIDAIKLECSLVSLYDGDKTFEYYFDFFKKNGFELFDIETGFSNPVTGQLLQFDALFIRR